MTCYLGVELLVLPQQVHAQLGQPDEVLQLAGGRHRHLAYHVLGRGVGKRGWQKYLIETKILQMTVQTSWRGYYLLLWPPLIISRN